MHNLKEDAKGMASDSGATKRKAEHSHPEADRHQESERLPPAAVI
jgi:hypothetical protein